MRPVDYYKILGIPRSADEGTIRRVIREKLKELHPDRTHALPPDLREYSDRRFRLVMEARKVLLDPEKRRAYDESLGTSMVMHTCPRCGEVNFIPQRVRTGSFVCRSCGAELFRVEELPLDEPSLASLVFSALLTVRNMGLQRLGRVDLEVARGASTVEITFSGDGSYLRATPSFPDLLDTETRVLGIRRGRDRGAAQRMVQRLMAEDGPWMVRFSPVGSRWTRWASTFLATSLFGLTPADARDMLEEHGWNLSELLRTKAVRPDYIERLKANWRAMVDPMVVRN